LYMILAEGSAGRANLQSDTMSIHAKVAPVLDASGLEDFLGCYLETLSLVERLHRLLLDVVKDEFERLGIIDINSVQALLLFNIGDNEVTAGELKTRGYYQGSNVSYNLKKLVAGILGRDVLGNMRLEDINASLRRMERYWSDQIRYIY
jgi:hypothetical protein